MYRKTYAQVHCETLTNNVKNIIENYKYDYYIGVVKANAYGHGDYVINSLIKGGINYLAASSLEECLNIRKKNADIPILCLEKIDADYLEICEEENVTITITDMDYFNTLDLDRNVKAHIKIDSGMNRLGFKDKDEVKFVYDKLSTSNITLEGIYTHFGTSGMWDNHYDEAIDNFKEITSKIDLNKIPIVHLGRSLTLVTHPKLDFATGVRLGIIMYGFDQNMTEPTGLRKLKRDWYLKKHNISPITYKNNLKLNTAFTLHSTVMSIKDVKQGEYVGYGAKYIAKEDIKIAILPIGFADGILKGNENLTVKINDRQYQIIGEIGMDMITVKIDDKVHLDDDVIIYDDIKTRSKELGISAYTLLTSITTRVPRVYKDDGKKVTIKY